MALWDYQDSEYQLLRRWLEAARLDASLDPAFPASAAWRHGDSDYNVLTKILRTYIERFSLAGDDEHQPRALDSRNFLLRKTCQVLTENTVGVPDDAEHRWRPLDSDRDLLAKILKALCVEHAEADFRRNFMPGDSETDCLRKIVAQIPSA